MNGTTETINAEALAHEAEKQAAYTAGLRALADLLDAHPQLIENVSLSQSDLLVSLGWMSDPMSRMAEFIRAALDRRLPIKKTYDDEWGTVFIDLGGGVRLQVYARREQVCERIVTGTREVTREVPDPEALKAVPTVTVTETVEDVRWDCKPLLSESVSA